jgi:hypothetical protein
MRGTATEERGGHRPATVGIHAGSPDPVPGAPVLTGRALRGQQEQPDVENRADRTHGEFPTCGVQDPDLCSFVIVCEFQTGSGISGSSQASLNS